MSGLKVNKLRNELKEIIVASGASMNAISEAAGFNRNILNQFISGRHDLKLKTLVKVASSLGYRLTFERIEK